MPALVLNSLISPTTPNRIHFQRTTRMIAPRNRHGSCQASKNSTSNSSSNGSRYSYNSRSSASSWVMEYDLYELLGVERSSGQAEIKAAYRSLQKRCHPDVAGAAGHDMAIVLNEVYSLLSDPAARLAYDQEQAKQSEFRGYTGKPLYSTWLGSENEERAVFVDEVKCVGCLKCALFASKTFAIESVYGRARVVAQWADSEDKILDAIQTCPVDCISMVERSNLAALEFLMSKQPRGNVRISEGNTVGARVSNIFADVDKFHSRFHKMQEKASRRDSKESEIMRGSRTSAVHSIRSISNWLYWSPFKSQATVAVALLRLPLSSTTSDPLTERLHEAADRRNAAAKTQTVQSCTSREDYWTPMLNLPPASSTSSATLVSPPNARQDVASQKPDAARKADISGKKAIIIDLRAPFVMAIISAAIVGSGGEDIAGSGLKEHVGGAVALGVVNSFELQVILAGITWFVIGMVVVGLVQVLRSREEEISR